MNIEQLRHYCLSKKGVDESFPFDDNVLVFKVLGKIFALTPLSDWERGAASINLKCDPEYAQELRTIYHCIRPGYHMNKKHWNTLYIAEGCLKDSFVQTLIAHSYTLVVGGISKKQRVKYGL